MKPARFLVLRGGALGDFIVTLPVLAALRERWPDGFVEVVGYTHIAELARAGGLADRVTSLHGANIARFFSLRPDFPEEQVDWIRSFDFILTYLHDPDGLVADNLKRAGARTVLYGSPLVTEGHAVDHLMKPLTSLAIYADAAIPRLTLGPGAADAGRARVAGQGVTGPFAVLHPGSGSPRKNRPLSEFLERARRLQSERCLTPVFLTGEADAGVARELEQASTPFLHLQNLPLLNVAELLSAASQYIGNDSGITHLAAALGTPTLALFGPSDPAQWSPRGPHVHLEKAAGSSGVES